MTAMEIKIIATTFQIRRLRLFSQLTAYLVVLTFVR